MARKTAKARGGGAEPVTARKAGAMLARRVGWVALAGLWLFLVVALGSFDSADWPSHAVAVFVQFVLSCNSCTPFTSRAIRVPRWPR